MTRASLYDESINEDSIAELYGKLAEDSPSHASWGQSVYQPIQGVKRKRNGGIGRKRRGVTTTEMTQGMLLAHQPIVPNSPLQSPILRLSLEVRECIYECLLIVPNDILVKSDWQTAERNPKVCVNILRTCKQ